MNNGPKTIIQREAALDEFSRLKRFDHDAGTLTRDDLSRRRFLKTAVGTLLAIGTAPVAFATGKTPGSGLEALLMPEGGCNRYLTMNEGPLYPPTDIPWASELTHVPGQSGRAQGQLLYLFGTITDRQCRPVSGALVEIWQTDNNGIYKHPRQPNQDSLDPNFRYFGRTKTKEDGSYLFKTIVPIKYRFLGIERAPHIHIRMRHLNQGSLLTEVEFEGEDDERVRQKDPAFLGFWKKGRRQLIVPKESPHIYAHMNIPFEKDALCCKYDLAFL